MSSLKNKIYKRKSGLPWQQIDGQSLILNPEEHEAHELNETASFIWSRLDGEATVLNIIQSMQEEFLVDDSIAEDDVLEFIQHFSKMELLECQ